MGKKYKDVKVTYETCYYDVEIDDEEIEEAKKYGIDIKDDEALLQFHLENNFEEHVDLLSIENIYYEVED